MNNPIPLEEAATRLQSTPLNVLMHIKRKLLQGEECDGNWFVEAASLETFLQDHAEATPGSVCEQKSCTHTCSSCG